MSIMLPLFILYLCMKLAWSSLRMFTDATKFFLPFLLSTLTAALIFSFALSHATTPVSPTPPREISAATITATTSPSSAQKQQLDQQITYWEKALNLQSTHRDILLNLATLYRAIGNSTKANEFLTRAKSADPNYHFSH